MKRFLHNVAERIKSMRDGRTNTDYLVSWDQAGVTVQWLTMENTTGTIAFSWRSVIAVDTFKRDYFTMDCICLAFQTPEGWVEVNEEMKGWTEFLKALESLLPGFPSQKQWWHKVMIPAFDSNHARLWTK